MAVASGFPNSLSLRRLQLAAPVGSRAMQLMPWGCRRLALVWGPMRVTGGTCTRVQGDIAVSMQSQRQGCSMFTEG